MRVLLLEAGWPEALIPQAEAVAWCESRWRPDAIGAGSYGLLQVQAEVWLAFFGYSDATAFLDPLVNLRAGWVIWQRAGSWAPWTCQPG